MTEPKKGSTEKLSETTKTNLIDIYTSNKYNRFTEISSKYLKKGNDVEEDSITLLSRMTKTFFTKNEQQLSNDFVKGTPDLFEGPEIIKATRIRDTKSSWDIFTFNRAKNKPLDQKYYWQGHGYMWLTGAELCNIDYCLNNTPYHIVLSELYREGFKHKDSQTPEWIELQIIANHTYDFETFEKYRKQRDLSITMDESKYIVAGFVEVPMKERYHTFEFKRNDEDLKRLENRIIDCRKFIKSTYES